MRRQVWEESEKKTARLYGRKVPGSGSFNEKMDVIGEGLYSSYRIENKATDAKSRSISLEELKKARNQAAQMGAGDFFFVIDFITKSMYDERYVTVQERTWINLHEELNELRQWKEDNWHPGCH